MRQEQIRITISKIHNWPTQNQQISLDIQFYSKQSQYLISRKHIDSRTHNNQLQLALTIKIRYPANENIIVIAVKQTNEDKHDIGEVQIDLQKFKEGGTKYVAFGGYEKIMQLEVLGKDGDRHRQDHGEVSMQERRVKNRQFILARQRFLEQYNNKQNKLKQQFQQKITSILNQKPHKIPIRQFKRPILTKQYSQYQMPQPQPQRQRQRQQITKISHDIITKSAINNEKRYEYKQNLGSSNIHMNIGGDLSSRNSAILSRYSHMNINSNSGLGLAYLSRNPSGLGHHQPKQHHKLILNTLNIVTKQDGNLG